MIQKTQLTSLSAVHKGMLFAFLGYTAFAFADICAKWLTAQFSVYQVIFMDQFMSCVFLLLALPWLGGVRSIKKTRHIPIHIIRTVLNIFIALLVVYSVSVLPIAMVYTFIFAKPFYAALFGILIYSQAVLPRHWLAIAVGFLGVLIALQPGTKAFDIVLILPILAGIIIALMFTLSRSLEGESIFSLGFWPIAGALPVVGILMLDDFVMPTVQQFAVVCIAGFLVAVAVVSVSLAFRMAPAATVSPFLYTEMLWALIFGFLIFGDLPDLYMLLGAAIIVSSGLFLIFSEKRKKRVA
ncbi:MAG: DMT family transporter [Alphaproteobacteria bacterium]|nr:DMT family transporter [Alphaproteobacteria bacterium]